MKIIVLISSLLVNLSTTAQINKYETRIKEVENLNIYGHGKTIIGKVIVNQSFKSEIFLLKSIQEKDTLGNYITTLSFTNKEEAPLLGVKIELNFNKPILKIDDLVSGSNISSVYKNGNTTFLFHASSISTGPFNNPPLTFKIFSKERILVNIKGIDGIIQ